MKMKDYMAKENKMTNKDEILEALGDGVVENLDPELRRAFDFADSDVPAELKDPKKLQQKEGHLIVSGDGVFYTLQGEGPTMGMPCVFLRLHICNLRCVWCDAWYTWNPKTKEFWTEPTHWTIEEAAFNIQATWDCDNPNVEKRLIITGGEPLLQQRKIEQLMDELPEWRFEIETNGTMMPSDKLLSRCQFNCSPKLENSGNARVARIKPEVLLKLAEGNTTFKFVVMKPEDLDEIEEDFIKGVGIPHNKVILMPQGVTAEEVRQNGQKVAEYAKAKGFRLLGRLQNELWGAKRGV